MNLVYGHIVKSASGKKMAVVTNGSTSMSLQDYARRTEREGVSPILAVRKWIDGYDVDFNKLHMSIENSDPYATCATVTFYKDEALELAREILKYYEEVV